MRHLWSASLALIVLSVVAAAAPAQSVDQIYRNNCLLCHRDRGQGGVAGAPSFLSDELRDPSHDRRFFDVIRNGVPDSGMEAFGESLNDAEVWALVGYIRELQAKHHRGRVGSPKAQRGVYRSQHHAYRVETIVEEGLSIPWSIEFLPDGRMLVADRPGALRLHSTGLAGGTLSQPVEGTPKVQHRGQGGLMDVALHPHYASTGWIYLAFTEPLEGGNRPAGMTTIVRGRLSEAGDRPRFVDVQTLFRAREEHFLPTDLHFGCRIAFDPSDPTILYFSIGDRGRQEMAQDLTRPNGKVHRIRDDGSIPQGNPFAGDASAYASIWSYGHRNPQGLAFGLDGRLWSTEHGPRGGDELNQIAEGRNYGWPVVSYGFHYNGRPFVTPWPSTPLSATDASRQGMVMPVWRWMPSIGACGLDVVRGEAFGRWRGDLLAGGLSGSNVDRLRIDASGALVEREEIVHGLGRVRDVVCAPDGTIYIALNDPDRIVRLAPAD